MRREQHRRLAGIHETSRTDPERGDVVIAPKLLGDSGDRLDDLERISRWGLAPQTSQDVTVLIDHAGRDFGAADINADRKFVGHQIGSARTRSAAPMIPASFPKAASRTSASGR